MAILASMTACMGSNDNGHDMLERESGSVSSGLINTNTTPVHDVDGQWYCMTVEGDNLKPADGRETCERTRAKCDEVRTIAQNQFGYTASACTPYPNAVCFPVLVEAQHRTIERCFITGEECERVFRRMQPGTGTGCAIQTNERPPTDGMM